MGSIRGFLLVPLNVIEYVVEYVVGFCCFVSCICSITVLLLAGLHLIFLFDIVVFAYVNLLLTA